MICILMGGTQTRPLKVEIVDQVEGSYVTKKNTTATRFVCISDTHNQHNTLQLPEGDVLIHAGDFSNLGSDEEVIDFNNFLGTLSYPHKLIVTGNHEHHWPDEDESNSFAIKMGFKKSRFKSLLSNGICLDNEEIVINEIRIHGICWSFGDPKLVYSKIKSGVNIIITHKPPKGILDGEHKGGGDLLIQHILSLSPRPVVHVFGHIHESYGTEIKDDILFINASICNSKTVATHPPVVFDVYGL